MKHALRPTGVLAVLAAAAALVPIHAARPADAQSYITVVDTDRRPVLGLAAEDFAMRDGAVRQPVIDVEPASAPLAVTVLLDGFDPGDRAALTGAIGGAIRALAAADPRHQVGLLVGDPAGSRAVDVLTSDRAALDASVGGVLTPAGAGGRRELADALVEACRTLRSAPTDRRVVLAILRRRAGDGAVARPGALTDAILLGKIALWTVEAGPAQSAPLDRLLTDVTGFGGALREMVPSTADLADAAARTASLLASQYVVTYAWPNPMLSQISITVRHDRGVVLTPLWTR